MAPEAYTLKGALDGWMSNETAEEIRMRAARAYDQYQRCGLKGCKESTGDRLVAAGDRRQETGD